ncbi:MAG: hypothetical protein A2014_00805 [Spirochaetes bacterium GWF1_49_6]|nr:MAG: hypothetical protein A2014_00805 [Spirochaetes bacterium GWF1_49_6]
MSRNIGSRTAGWVLCLTLVFISIIYPLTSESDFLKIPKSARAIGLGDSYTSIIGDSTAIEYNPAAMNTIENFALSFMYQSWIDNAYACYLSGAMKIYDFVIGTSLYYVDYGGFSHYDAYGMLLSEYQPHDICWKAAISMDGGLLFDFLTGFSVGIGAGVIGRGLADFGTWGLTLDLGINYTFTLQRLGFKYDSDLFRMPINAGFALQNIGFTGDTAAPLKGTLGISAGLAKDLYLSLDVALEYGRPFLYKMGIEYTLFNILILRTGFNLGRDTGNLAFGLGLRYPEYFNDLRLDYAFSYMGALGNNHNFSLYVDFPVFVDQVSQYYQQGIYHYLHGDYELAKEKWLKALAIDPENKLVRKKLDDLEKLMKLNQMVDSDNGTSQ